MPGNGIYRGNVGGVIQDFEKKNGAGTNNKFIIIHGSNHVDYGGGKEIDLKIYGFTLLHINAKREIQSLSPIFIFIFPYGNLFQIPVV